MTLPSSHLIFLFSDTGGGHRSAAQALIGALERQFPGQFTCELVDIFRELAPRLINRIPDNYPWLSSHPRLLGQIFQHSDHPRVIRFILRVLWPFLKPGMDRLLREHPADLYISVHPLINYPLARAFEQARVRTPWGIVVTDLVSAHTTWFSARADWIVVPTPEARQVALRRGISEERLRVLGLPVAVDFCDSPVDPLALRRELDWPLDRPVVLLMGGGEGVGRLEELAGLIDAAALPVTLVIVAGRNLELRQRLETRDWHIPVRVYGFVQNIPVLMKASNILLSKAGPGTLSEAACAGLPVILYGKLNGSEDGNVRYFAEKGMGIWAPRNDQVRQALNTWLADSQAYRKARDACQAYARPRAALDIARLIASELESKISRDKDSFCS